MCDGKHLAGPDRVGRQDLGVAREPNASLPRNALHVNCYSQCQSIDWFPGSSCIFVLVFKVHCRL